MGMEGKLRRISEFELAAYRKSPAKLYSELFPVSGATLADFGKITSAMQNVQQSEVGKRVRERALAGENPLPEDVEGLKREMEEVMRGFPGFAQAMKGHMPGLTEEAAVAAQILECSALPLHREGLGDRRLTFGQVHSWRNGNSGRQQSHGIWPSPLSLAFRSPPGRPSVTGIPD